MTSAAVCVAGESGRGEGDSIETAGRAPHHGAMIFTEKRAKGVGRCLVDTQLKGEPLHYPISEVAPGVR